MGISVWIRDRPQRQHMGSLPAEVDLRLIPDEGPLPTELREAEFVVPPVRAKAVLELLREMPRLAVVQSGSAGTDWLEPWVPAGVTLCNARGTRDNAVAEWVLSVVLAMEKRLPHFARRRAEHDWQPHELDELSGKRALIVGYGSIGKRTGELLKAFGLMVDGVASSAREGVHGVDELPELLPNADVVVVLVPLTAATRGLFDGRMLARMREDALLVNASRGPVLDTDALVEQLASGRLRAALDVTDPEPLPANHPLWDAPELLLTPHLAGDSPQAEERVYELIGEQIRRYVAGEPLVNLVQRRDGP